jgi:hypothetical protein
MSVAKRVGATVAVVIGAVLALGLAFAASSSAAPYSNPATCSTNTSNPAVGGTVVLSCTGFGGNDTVDITLHTVTYSLGSATTDTNGAFTKTLQLPAGVSGPHTIVAFDPTTGQSASVAITIGSSGGTSGGGTSSGGGSSSGGGLSNTGVAVIGIGALGVVLLVGGGLMLLAGRRRKATI